MFEFFRGWRRKIGVQTLVLACVFMAGWVRSLSKVDSISVPCGDALYGVQSIDGRIDFSRTTNTEYPPKFDWFSVELSSMRKFWVDANGNPREIDPWPRHEMEWRWDWAGFHFGAGTASSFVAGIAKKRRDEDYMLPFWSIVIPPTLLSAFLLLLKAQPIYSE